MPESIPKPRVMRPKDLDHVRLDANSSKEMAYRLYPSRMEAQDVNRLPKVEFGVSTHRLILKQGGVHPPLRSKDYRLISLTRFVGVNMGLYEPKGSMKNYVNTKRRREWLRWHSRLFHNWVNGGMSEQLKDQYGLYIGGHHRTRREYRTEVGVPRFLPITNTEWLVVDTWNHAVGCQVRGSIIR